MSDPTGTPPRDLLANALRVLADMAGTLYVRQPDGLTVVQLLAHEQQERDIILGALSGIEHTEQPAGAGQLHTWRGWLAGWHLHLVQWLPTPDAAALLAESAALSDGAAAMLAGAITSARAELADEADPDACTCWMTSRNGCPVHHLADDWDEQMADSAERARAAWFAVDTSPATAAAEQPAGLASAWPAVVPAQRPPSDMLPAPSWALVGLESAFSPLVTPGPLTDPALAGREQTAEVA